MVAVPLAPHLTDMSAAQLLTDRRTYRRAIITRDDFVMAVEPQPREW